MLVLLVERSLWIRMVVGEPMEVEPSLAKTTQRWTDQLHMQPAGWPNLLWKPVSVVVFWFRYGLSLALLLSRRLLLSSFFFFLNKHHTRHYNGNCLGDGLQQKKGRLADSHVTAPWGWPFLLSLPFTDYFSRHLLSLIIWCLLPYQRPWIMGEKVSRRLQCFQRHFASVNTDDTMYWHSLPNQELEWVLLHALTHWIAMHIC